MDSFEWNKILGAILGTLLFVFIVREVASIVYPSDEHVEELAYKIEIPEGGTAATGESKTPEPVDFGTLLKQASAEQGESIAKRCQQCHTFEKGGPNRTGPNLWGILGHDIAARPEFRYSNALSQLEGEWTYERIYEFVGAPSKYVPGTSMNFAGLPRQSQRIDLLAYLRTQDDNPPPIPDPLPEKSAEEPGDAAAEGGESSGEGTEESTEETGEQSEEAAPADEESGETTPSGPDAESGADEGNTAAEGTDDEGAKADEENASDDEASENGDGEADDDQ